MSIRYKPGVNFVIIYIYRKKLVGGRKECNDSERDGSTEEQLRVTKHLCHIQSTMSPTIATDHDDTSNTSQHTAALIP